MVKSTAKSAATSDVDVVVVGAGPAGLTAAIALARWGVNTALVSPRLAATDNRTSGLLIGSVTALDLLGVWQHCRPHAVAIRGMRIVEDTQRLPHAPDVAFLGSEIGLDAIGYNIENRFLLAALEERAASLPLLTRVDDRVEAVVGDESGVTVRLGGGASVRAQLAVGADGHRSLCRRAAGIAFDGRTYPQAAIALCFGHDQPHHDTSIEFHSRSEPLTLVPLPGARSSLVFVAAQEVVARIAALDDARLSEEFERRSHAVLGRIVVEPGRGTFPIATQSARRFGAGRIALVGEAAHVIPPFGGHGLNLGLRDAATIAELVAAARRERRDVGAAEVLARYDAMRRPDIGSLRRWIGFATRLMLSDSAAVQSLRGASKFLLHNIGPLRRKVMRKGLAPPYSTPRLMRGEEI